MANKYTEYPHTQFPAAKDDEANHPLMSDVSSDTLALATQYQNYVAAGNATSANALLAENPKLAASIFNADKYNWMRDAIFAIQKYYLEDVRDYILDTAAQRIGINDSATGDAKRTNAYSASKVDELITAAQNARTTIQNNLNSLSTKVTELTNKENNNEVADRQLWHVDVDTSGWSSAYPYKKTVNVTNMSDTYSPVWSMDVASYSSATADQARYKIQLKSITTNKGSITISCSKKPTVDFKLIGKGV